MNASIEDKLSKMDLDTESDEWIAIYISSTASAAERNVAAKKLFIKHKAKVLSQIKQKIQFGDAQNDISQEVWIDILNIDKLREKYEPQGKFGAYLYQNTKWKILDALKKDPGFVAEPEDTDTHSAYKDETPSYEDSMDARNLVVKVIPELSEAIRLVYILEYYEILFPSKPGISDIAEVNGMGINDATTIISGFAGQDSSTLSEGDRCLWILSEYENIVPTTVREKVTGYKAELAEIVGISYSAYRVRLTRANEFVKTKIQGMHPEYGATT